MNIVLLLAHIYSITTGMLSYGHGITIGGLADEYDFMMCLIEKTVTVDRQIQYYYWSIS